MSSRIAVVITCYELGGTLPDAVSSVVSQTAPAREIVVVDDGSRDPLTRQVIESLDARYPRVRAIRSEHRGAAHARNLGIASTKAPYVVLLDGDDLFEPTYLERAEALLRQHPELSFVCCALQAFGRASYRWKPPPYGVADAVGRGACGHISTVFRREVWDQVGGFDGSLPAYEDVDFWLRALELGFRGTILDDALVRYRVRAGSRYHSAVVREEYVRAKAMLLDNHWDAVAPCGEDVFVSLLDFQRELTGHARSLDDEQEKLAETLDLVEGEVADVREALAARNVSAFDWGRLDEPLPLGGTKRHSQIERHYARQAAKDVLAERGGKATVTIKPGDAWPDAAEPGYAALVIAGALEYEADPAAALASCRAALRPGGTLVAAAATMALGEGRVRGFTEASLRSLLCDLFPPADVTVRSYGNLLTCLAEVAGLPVHELARHELDASDPAHPTIIAASARVPPRGWAARSRRRREAPPRVAAAATPRRRGAILAYHRIASLEPDVHALCVPPDRFRAQMRLLAERYEPQALDDLVAEASVGELRPGAVAVTFDDGYFDNLQAASPILTELGIPATFFVNSPPQERREPWWDTIARILLSDERIPERLTIKIGKTELRLPAETAPQRRSAVFALHAHLLDAQPAQIAAVERELADWSGLDLPVRDSHRLMTSRELIELSERPRHQVGAHGLHHLRLPAHPQERQARELRDSRAELERLLGSEVTCLAYPYGACNLATTDIAEEAGFAVGCTVDGDVVSLDSDPLRVPRLEVPADPVEQLEFQLERLVAEPA